MAEPGSAMLDRVRAEFDPDHYLAAYPDVAAAGLDPFEHFMEWGWADNRDPNAWFSTARYLNCHADIAAAGINPFVHYIEHGRAEGRALDHGLGFRHEAISAAVPYEQRIQAHRHAWPDREPDPPEALRAALDRAAAGPVHLTVSHDDFTRTTGGVQLCLRLEAEAMRARGRAHLHLFPAVQTPVIEFERAAPLTGVLVDGALAGVFRGETVAALLGDWAAGRAVGFAIHSLLGHTVEETLATLQAMGAREGVFWLHDYASLCAGYTLMRDDLIFCGAPPPDSAACRICHFGERRRIHLAAHARLFERFEVTVLAPSAAALMLWRRSYPFAVKAARVHPHARLLPRGERPAAGERPVNVAFLGAPTLHKGWPLFASLSAARRADPRYVFHHLSEVAGAGGAARFTRVRPTPDDPAPMARTIAELGVDLAVVWSLWPETFCFTAHEAVAGGAAVITHPGAGHVADLVRQSGHGRVLAGEAALFDFFAGDEPLRLARAPRPTFDLAYSRMAADLPGAAA